MATGVRDFGEYGGMKVHEVILDNGIISCSVLDYGCTLRSLSVPDRKGIAIDVVLGYESLEDYITSSGRMGATIGRCANRISKASFNLNGITYQLAMNRFPNHIHGGEKGFDKRVWEITECDRASLKMYYHSEDGEEGYPGNLDVSVMMSLEDCSLIIEYDAVSDMDTICNLTNHSYFDLSGRMDLSDHIVRIDAERYLPVDNTGIPTGSIYEVTENNDLRYPRYMSKDNRFDICYLLDEGGCAECRSDSTGIRMRVETDLPAIQFYTSDGLKECIGKNGMRIGPRSGLCFETQYPVDAPNNPNFGDFFLKGGERYRHRTMYSFETD